MTTVASCSGPSEPGPGVGFSLGDKTIEPTSWGGLFVRQEVRATGPDSLHPFLVEARLGGSDITLLVYEGRGELRGSPVGITKCEGGKCDFELIAYVPLKLPEELESAGIQLGSLESAVDEEEYHWTSYWWQEVLSTGPDSASTSLVFVEGRDQVAQAAGEKPMVGVHKAFVESGRGIAGRSNMLLKCEAYDRNWDCGSRYVDPEPAFRIVGVLPLGQRGQPNVILGQKTTETNSTDYSWTTKTTQNLHLEPPDTVRVFFAYVRTTEGVSWRAGGSLELNVSSWLRKGRGEVSMSSLAIKCGAPHSEPGSCLREWVDPEHRFELLGYVKAQPLGNNAR